MDYENTLKYLYDRLPMFQRIGPSAYKNNLDNTLALAEMFDQPQFKFRTVHVAGTNGKGSVSHTLAAVFQSAGYKTGLYTSPHLKDFRERIRIDGEMISKEAVVGFVSKYKELNTKAQLEPSFFELTVAMAFNYFASQKVDVAIVEVGLGGRLDSTNIVAPDLSIITNISFDHTNLLGNTLEAIAGEKAGIIKPRVPVVIGETCPETKAVFISKANEMNAPIFFAEETLMVEKNSEKQFHIRTSKGENLGEFEFELSGNYQTKNIATVYLAIEKLRQIGYSLSTEALKTGLAGVCRLTGLMGRWQTLGTNPLVICDTGHNEAGISFVVKQLENTPHAKLLMVIGMVNDKEIDKVLALLPKDASYFFTQANIERALPASELMRQAQSHGLKGEPFTTVSQAYKTALNKASPNDLIFVGGSSFVVSEVI